MLVCMCVGGGVEGYASVHVYRWRCGGYASVHVRQTLRPKESPPTHMHLRR